MRHSKSCISFAKGVGKIPIPFDVTRIPLPLDRVCGQRGERIVTPFVASIWGNETVPHLTTAGGALLIVHPLETESADFIRGSGAKLEPLP